ncbi:phage tail tip lysozyme [Pseudomonas citronellolis]|uniref:phage tail tip lysozyme n=1 Tax=Pseudomonas citronellolis TaxID=53408 RepID=UPI00389AA50C
MADSDVIKEFLVGLGFKVDEKGLKTFTGGIDNATKAVTKLVTTLAGASLTVAAGVSAFASNLESLYYAAQRTGAAADSLKAADYAARDLGASAAEVRGSLEGMARFLRDNPGGEGFLQSLGVQTRDARGNIKDTADILVGLGQRLRSMPWYQAKQYASILGVDENTLRAIMNGEFGRKLEENRKKLAGAGLNQATRDAHQFMMELRGIGLQFEALGTQVQAELMHRLGPELAKFSDWFEKNSPMIAGRIVDVTEKLITLAQDSEPYLKSVYEFFVKLDQATDGWSTKIIVLLGLMRMLGLTSLVTGILNLASAFVRLGGGIAGASTAAAGASALSSLVVGAGALLYSSSLNEGEDAEVARIRRERGLPDQEPKTPSLDAMANAWRTLQGVDKDKSTFAMDFFKAQGWSDAQAAGIVSNLAAESNLNPHAIGDWGRAAGIGQWHPDRQQAFEKFAGFSLHDPRADLMKQLEFVQYELTQGAEQKAGKLLMAAQNAQDAGAVVSRYYERPAAADAEAAKRGAMAVQMTQKTEIHVNGGGDPNSTAQAVAGAQGRVNQDMVRNLNTAVQ